MGTKGQSTSNTQQTQTYDPAGASYIQSALQQGQAAAQTPFSQPVAPVAGFSPDQLAAFQTVNNSQGIAQPYINQAAQDFTPQGTQAFFNPYAANVQASLQNTFGEQQQQATGSLTQAAGGVGADRIAVGQADLANQQALAQGQTMANLYGQAAQQAQSAGYGTAALGSQAQNSALTGAQAQLGTGGLQQQLQQAQLNAPYQQQLAALAYPFQTAQFNAGITGALAPGLGGTTTGVGATQSTAAPPSIWSQLLGLGAAGTGLAGGLGAFNGKGSTAGGTPGTSIGGASGPTSLGGAAGPTPLVARGGAIYPHYAEGGDVVPIRSHDSIENDIARSRQLANENRTEMDRTNVVPIYPLRRREGYDDGGSTGLPTSGPYQVPQGLSDKPINVGPQSVVPGMQLRPIQSQQPHLNLSAPTAQQPASNSLTDATKALASAQQIGKLFAGSKRGGRIGYDEGGDVSDKPIDIAPQSVVPEEQLTPIQAQMPSLNLNPPTQAAASGSSDLSSIASLAGTAAKIGALFIKRGGAVPRYADAGVVDDPFGDDNRAAGYDLLRAGMGTTAPDSIPGGEPAPGPYRLAGPDAMDAWRKGDDASRALLSTDVSDGSTTPSALPSYITSGASAADVGDQPYKVLAFAPSGSSTPSRSASVAAAPDDSSTPTQTSHSISDFAKSPWAALMQAGLAIAGGTSPYAGVNIGRGGLEGLNTLEKQREAAQKDETVKQSAKRLELEAEQHASQEKHQRWEESKPVPAGQVFDPQTGLNRTQFMVQDKDGKWTPVAGAPVTDAEGKPVKGQAALIGDEIISGNQPPTTTGLGRITPQVRAYLAQQKFNLADASLQWSRAQKQIQALNGPQMTRGYNLYQSVNSTIDEVKELSGQMQLGGIPFMNRLELQKYIQTQGNSEKGQLATRYMTAVNTLKEEFANLANGGYAPTEPAWKLADEQINGNYGVKSLASSLDEIKRLVGYRMKFIADSPVGPGAANRYTGDRGQQQQPQQPAQAAPSDPVTLKAQGAAAIAHGAPRDAVIKQLQAQGVDTTGM
jgi:hypothetical protein